MADEESKTKETLTVTIDGRAIEARPGELVIAAAERHGTYIPRFCWHPRMKPVAMCRMCLVEMEGPKGKSLVPSCMVPASDGMVVATEKTSPAVKKAQDGVLEFLLINHPLDCPVCDRGGECPLQDQTMVYGPGESRFVEEKRHFAKPIPVNTLVALDRERCVQCARCTRFAEEIAGDPLLTFVERGNQLQILTFPDEPFVSYFSGNVVQICPVGALTATPYRFRARPWDLDQSEATCTTCAVGCRMLVQSSSDRLVRFLGIDSDPVNQGWLCDKGRFNFEAFGHDDRLVGPLVRKGDELVEASWGEALDTVGRALKGAIDRAGSGSVAVLGGSRLTNEDAYAWSKLARVGLGTDHVDAQLGDGLPAEVVLGLPRATIDDACTASAVVLLAPDLKEELPVLYLRLRDAAVERGVPLIELTPRSTGLSRYAAVTLTYEPGEVAEVATALVSGKKRQEAAGNRGADIGTAVGLLGERPVVILGRPSLAESAASVAEAAAILASLPGVRFLPALRRGNVHGALDMGLAPGVLPGRVSLEDGREWFGEAWGQLPRERGMDAVGILTAAAEGRIHALVLLGADPMADFPDRDLARRALAGAGFVVATDLFLTESSRLADVVLPAAGFGERAGTTTNLEGRVSRVSQKVTAPGTSRPDWMIAVELAAHLGIDLGFDSLADVWNEIERLAPSHRGLTAARLVSHQHRDGVVVPLDGSPGSTPAVLPWEAVAAGQGANVAGDPASMDAAGEESAARFPPPRPGEPPPPEATPIPGTKGVEGEPVPVPGADEGDGSPNGPAATGRAQSTPPPLLAFTGVGAGAPHPRPDAYSLRLVTSRRLYDLGTLTQKSRSLAGLAPGAQLAVNPHDLDRLGVESGGQVRLTSSRGSMVLAAVADPGVPRGSVALPFNQPGSLASELVEAGGPVVDVRLETI